MEAKLTNQDLEILSKPFPEDVIGVKVQSFSKDKTKAMLVLYMQHTDTARRIEEVDPSWSCEVISEITRGSTISVSMKLTVKGVSRQNVGEAEDSKSAYSDALKRAAMLFGVGRYLYDTELVWVDYNDSMKFKVWTIEEYRARCKAKPILQTSTTSLVVDKKPLPTERTVQGVMGGAKHAGKTFEDFLKEDSVNDFKYAKWVSSELEKPGNKLALFQKNYLKYAISEGVFI